MGVFLKHIEPAYDILVLIAYNIGLDKQKF